MPAVNAQSTLRPSDPAFNAFAVTTSNSDQPYVFRALYIGTYGDVVIQTKGGANASDPGPQIITFKNVPSGFILPVCGTQVTTATTASNIVALY